MSFRYSRMTALLGKRVLSLIQSKRIAIVGVGGIGSNSALLCAQLGFKKISLIDRDVVEESNLSRQAIYAEESVEKPKALEAEKRLKKINSGIEIKGFFQQLDEKNAVSLISGHDFVLDCTDNFKARKEINIACLTLGVPWIFSSALGEEAMLSTIVPGKKPCFECWAKEGQQIKCEEVGILGTTTSFVASMQVQELINLIQGKPNFCGRLFYADLNSAYFETVGLKKRRNCFACKKETMERNI